MSFNSHVTDYTLLSLAPPPDGTLGSENSPPVLLTHVWPRSHLINLLHRQEVTGCTMNSHTFKKL